MTDYIKREDAINTIRNTYTGMTSDTLELRINDIPSADVAPVRHGIWLEATRDDPCYYICSECGRMSDFEDNYCPNCGAKMDGDADD